MEALNRHLFLLLNAPPDPSPATVLIARILADDVVVLVAALMAVLWVWGRRDGRGALVTAGCALLIAAVVSTLMGAVWAHPRPFMVGLGRTLLPHAAETSFPSDHATFMWTIALSFLAGRPWRALGWVLLLFGIGVAWARVYVGVHFPLDMAGSLVVAAFAASVAALARPALERVATPGLVRLYEALVRALRLPGRLFPLGRD